MSITDIAMKRYSTKSFDPAKKISPEILEKLKMLLRYSPSSVNIQPWNFIIAESEEAKARIAKSTQGDYHFNTSKITDASHVVVFCAKTHVNEQYLSEVLQQEDTDGRFALPEHKEMMAGARDYFINIHKDNLHDLPQWLEKQVFLNLGSFLLGSAALGLDSVPMEGLDFDILDNEFNLSEQGLKPIAVVSLGYRTEDDFNAQLTKSRLAEDKIITLV
ncbi:oxygen-insensitive NAD(P)H nitroreductase [Providencia heimbachae]|uniref:oxygen-insensitive NAD(P)H nitroreductase n=1 Tax=Providencia heimbachae TaxID=333962 RepID=UPI0010BF668A|nr:oxygen-insensitive NAD(P)H nitroreductase [Providencia heimbachae]QCJ70760.1 oxygen-insensitive NAD(P)H nitroreductase [Providencia heimbachae]